jgi:hypothetical protein
MEVVLALQIELHCVYRKSEYTERNLISKRVVRFEVITVINMKITVLWDVILSSLIESYQNFRRTSTSRAEDDITSQKTVIFSQCITSVEAEKYNT